MDGSRSRGEQEDFGGRERRRLFRRPSPFVWLILSAALFLVGAAAFSGHGAKEMAEFGVFGAVAAIALIVVFLY